MPGMKRWKGFYSALPDEQRWLIDVTVVGGVYLSIIKFMCDWLFFR
jgi:hypothetical protein